MIRNTRPWVAYAGTLISQKYAEVKLVMDTLLKGTLGAETTDRWPSASGDAYYGFITYHGIDPKWVLHSLPIAIAHHKGTTTGPDHADGLEAELAKHWFDLEQRACRGFGHGADDARCGVIIHRTRKECLKLPA